MFSFICWAVPTNVPVNQLFGVRSGMGMSVLTFDWTQITWIGSPLMGERVFLGSTISFLALYLWGVKLATEPFGGRLAS